MVIRRIKIGESNLYKEIRLRALLDAPYAFSTTYESALKRSTESWEKQANDAAQGSDRALFFVINEKPVGLSALYRSSNNQQLGEIKQVWISPEYRGKGIADNLLLELINWGKANDYKLIEANVIKGNERAIRFYEKNGFMKIREENNDGFQELVLSYICI
jgi:ribosomal protein S18 acetylase RimI-like enzyme